MAGAAIEGKSEAAGREESFEDIFGASLSRKGTLNSTLINLKEQELLEVKAIQACYPRVQPPPSIEVPFPRGNFRSMIENGVRDKDKLLNFRRRPKWSPIFRLS